MSQAGKDWIVAATVATEVPPPGTTALDDASVALARQAVCNVIRARVTSGRFPNDPVLVVLQPKQFSAVCTQDYWRNACAGLWCPSHVAACLAEWQGSTGNAAAGALWYYSPISMIPKDAEPVWVPGKTEILVPGLDREFFRFYQ